MLLRALFRPLLAVVLLAGAAVLPAQAQTAPFTDAQRDAIGAIVRDYLVAHPEVILESIEVLRSRDKATEAESRKKALTERKKDLFDDPNAPFAGNATGDVTVVEFFDYQCGYCKSARDTVNKLVEQDPKVKLVYKEYPILGPASLVASQAALASQRQGKYVPFHNALMGHKGKLDDETIQRIARSVGLDTDKLKKDMAAPEIQSMITANIDLADALSINGTPAFIVGDQIVPGAIDLAAMKRLVAGNRPK